MRLPWCQQGAVAVAAAVPAAPRTLVKAPNPVVGVVLPALAACILVSSPALAVEGTTQAQLPPAGAGISWAACRPKTSCVSSNSFMSPAQYLPPWSFAPAQQEVAFRNLLDQLDQLHATVISTDTSGTDGEYYVLAQLPTGSSSSNSSSYDTVQIKLRADGVALFKSEAARNTPDPPFCLTPGCISGPGNRQRMERLRDALGWSVLETDEDKKWVQILLH